METDVKMKVSSYSALSTYCFVQANRKLQTRLQRWKLFFFPPTFPHHTNFGLCPASGFVICD